MYNYGLHKENPDSSLSQTRSCSWLQQDPQKVVLKAAQQNYILNLQEQYHCNAGMKPKHITWCMIADFWLEVYNNLQQQATKL